MIIKGIFGNNDGDKPQRKASSNPLKYCGICQTAMKRPTDNIDLAHCADCISHDRTSDAAHWKNVYANKKANSLSPDMQKLADKLAANRSLIEGKKMTRGGGVDSDRTERNLNEIRKGQASLNEVDFGTVKAQVAEMLPSILNELGLGKKVNADLLADLIVPIKIASPIVDSNAGRSALKSIVHEVLAHLDVTREMTRESSVKPHGTVVPFDIKQATLLNEGFGRVSNDHGNRSRLIEKIADIYDEEDPNDPLNPNMPQPYPQEMPPGNPSLDMSPSMGDPNMGDPNMMGNPGMDPMGAGPPGMGGDPGMDPMGNDSGMSSDSSYAPLPGDDGMGPDPSSESGPAPSADVGGSEQLEGQSGVTHLDDETADSMINEPPPGQAPPQGNPSQMMGGEDPNIGTMPNEGIGTYSDDSMVPDAADMDDMPQEGAINRVDQAGPDIASRQVAYLKQRIPKPSKFGLFNYAGKISSLPVQSVKLSVVDKTVIENYPPISKFAAVFSDRSKVAWNYYLTDSGYLMVSTDNTFHAKSLEAFANFVESDSTFTKWALLPDELQVDMPPVMDPKHDVNDMALPSDNEIPSNDLIQSPVPGSEPIPGGEATPGFNEIPETNLGASSDNSIGGGLMNEQDAIFDNSGDTSNPADIQSTENEVVDTASDMLPHIQEMFPDESPEEHTDMAISAALNLLTNKYAVKDKSAATIIKKAINLNNPVSNNQPGSNVPLTENRTNSPYSLNNDTQQDPYDMIANKPNPYKLTPAHKKPLGAPVPNPTADEDEAEMNPLHTGNLKKNR